MPGETGHLRRFVPPIVSGVPAARELVSNGPLPLYVSGGGHTPGHQSPPSAHMLIAGAGVRTIWSRCKNSRGSCTARTHRMQIRGAGAGTFRAPAPFAWGTCTGDTRYLHHLRGTPAQSAWCDCSVPGAVRRPAHQRHHGHPGPSADGPVFRESGTNLIFKPEFIPFRGEKKLKMD